MLQHGQLANFIGQAHNFALCTVDGILHILDFLQFFQHLPFIAQLDNEQMQLIHYQGFQQFFWNLVADALIVGLPCLADVIADLFTFLRSIWSYRSRAHSVEGSVSILMNTMFMGLSS